MAISIEKSRIIPSIEYKYVHLNEFSVKIIENEDSSVRYETYVDITFYAIINGKRKFDVGNRKQVKLDDFLLEALQLASEGNNSLLEIAADFENLVAKYVENTMDVGSTAVVEV